MARLKFLYNYADIERVKPSPAKEKSSGFSGLALPGQRYVARQPILDRAQDVLATKFFSAMVSKITLMPIPNLPPVPPWIVRCSSALPPCAIIVAPS
jgi:hypothetical protein